MLITYNEFGSTCLDYLFLSQAATSAFDTSKIGINFVGAINCNVQIGQFFGCCNREIGFQQPLSGLNIFQLNDFIHKN